VSKINTRSCFFPVGSLGWFIAEFLSFALHWPALSGSTACS
jgi:hypothetical protein